MVPRSPTVIEARQSALLQPSRPQHSQQHRFFFGLRIAFDILTVIQRTHTLYLPCVMSASEPAAQPGAGWDEAQCMAALAQLEQLQAQVRVHHSLTDLPN